MNLCKGGTTPDRWCGEGKGRGYSVHDLERVVKKSEEQGGGGAVLTAPAFVLVF